MFGGAPWWVWAISNIVVPVVIGLGSALLGYISSVKQVKSQLSIVERRAVYNDLTIALADLAAAFEFYFREAYNQGEANAARGEEWKTRQLAAGEVLEKVRVNGTLAASSRVLAILGGLTARKAEIDLLFRDGDYLEALDESAVMYRDALDDLHAAIDKEFE